MVDQHITSTVLLNILTSKRNEYCLSGISQITKRHGRFYVWLNIQEKSWNYAKFVIRKISECLNDFGLVITEDEILEDGRIRFSLKDFSLENLPSKIIIPNCFSVLPTFGWITNIDWYVRDRKELIVIADYTDYNDDYLKPTIKPETKTVLLGSYTKFI